jgi:hypothetical protein
VRLVFCEENFSRGIARGASRGSSISPGKELIVGPPGCCSREASCSFPRGGSCILLWQQRSAHRFVENSPCVCSLIRAWVSREEINHQGLGVVTCDRSRACESELSLFGFFGLAGNVPSIGTVPSPRLRDTQARTRERTQHIRKRTHCLLRQGYIIW